MMTPAKIDRMKKIDSLLLKTLSEIIPLRVKDPHIGIFSLTEVQTSRDLKYAKIFVSVIGDDEIRQHTLAIFNKMAGVLRHHLNEEVRLRSIPQLTFILDTTGDYSQKIETLIQMTKRPLEHDE